MNETETVQKLQSRITALSLWIDHAEPNARRDDEAATWGRLAKIGEEFGEVIAAFIGYTGQNPRKGVTHTRLDVLKELLDVAVTALAAAEHVGGHEGLTLPALADHVRGLSVRAGIEDR